MTTSLLQTFLLSFLLVSLPLSLAQTQAEDQLALNEFYASLSVTGLLPTSLPANWCEVVGVSCNEDGRVVALDFHDFELLGSIPSSLGSLTALRSIDLSANELSGEIPSAFATLGLSAIFLGDNFLCPISDYSSWAPKNDFTTTVCIAGSKTSCSTCAAETFANATWPETDAGTNATGTCLPGFVGTPVRRCKSSGSWKAELYSSCVPAPVPTGTTPSGEVNNNGNGLSTASMAGIIAGSVMAFLLLLALAIFFVIKRRKDQKDKDAADPTASA